MNPIQITVGGAGQYDPAVGATDYLNPALLGTAFYVELSGSGTMAYASYSVLPSGGFRLLSGTFQAGQVYFVHINAMGYAPSAAAAYSNGFNTPKVMAALFGRIGFREAVSASVPAVNAIHTSSRSGRSFQDFHPLVSLDVLHKIQDDPAIDSAGFNALLESTQKSAIMRLLTAVFSEREIIEQRVSFDRYWKMDALTPNSGKFVGYRLNPAPDFGIAAQIDSVSLYFDQNVTFPLYLFHETRAGYVWKQNVTAIANTATMVQLPDVVLKYMDENTMGGGFYLGYFQSDLGTAKAYREQVLNYNPGLCLGWRMIETAATGVETFDRNGIAFTSETHGLNIAFSTFRDPTSQIVYKASMFDNGIGLSMAISVLDMIQFSVRSNKSERITKEMIDRVYADLNLAIPTEDFPYVAGLKTQLDREAKRLHDTFFPPEKISMNQHDTFKTYSRHAVSKNQPYGY